MHEWMDEVLILDYDLMHEEEAMEDVREYV